MSTTDSFGYWLRRRRKAHDLTQRKLADLAGCTEAMIRRIEADERRPSDQLAGRIADALNVPHAERAAFLKAARGVGRVDRLDLAVLSTGPPPALTPPPALASAPSLPAPPNTLIAVWALLLQPETRLVSLTGIGGTGKTRLALQVAAELLDQFPEGVHLVDLSPVSDPALALPAIATAWGYGNRLAGASTIGSWPIYPGGAYSCSTTSSRSWPPGHIWPRS